MQIKTQTKYFYFFATIVVLIFIWLCRPQGLYFLADDFVHIPLSAGRIFYDDTWLRPVSRISLWVNSQIFGMNYWGFYFTNVLFHLINAVLIYFLSTKIKRFFFEDIKENIFFPFFSSLLFLVYCSHAESIFWIVGRGGSLVTIFIQLSLLFYFSTQKKHKIYSYLFFVFALFTYELSWALPLLISFFVICKKYIGNNRRITYDPLIYWVILISYFILRYGFLNGEVNDYEAGAYLHFNLKILFYHFITATSRIFVPAFENTLLFSSITAIVFTFFFLLFVKLFLSNKKLFFLMLICFASISICLFPILTFGANTHNSESERFIYPASVFFCIMIGYLISSLKNTQLRYLLAGIILIVNLLFFYISSNDYRYGSYVTKYVTDEINNLSDTDTLHLQNLPSNYGGAIIFRSGVPTSAQGIFNKQFKKIEHVSQKQLFQKKQFKTKIIHINSAPANVTFNIIADTLYIYK